MILPGETELSAPYWEGARRGELRLQTCLDCGQQWHPPSPLCPQCRGAKIEWRPSHGRGVVYSFTWVEHAAHPAFAKRLPYPVVLITLDEGPRVIANLRGSPRDELRIGLRVHVGFEEIVPGVVLPHFEARSDSAD